MWFTDHHIGRLLDFVAQQAWGGDTAVVVTSDHGEAFGEHGMSFHGGELWEPLVRVPLLVYFPGVRPHHVPVKRSHIDLVPTMLDLLGVEAPAQGELSGRSMLPDLLAKQGDSFDERDVYIDMPVGPYTGMRRALITGPTPGLKLYNMGPNQFALFDLATRPRRDRRHRPRRPRTLPGPRGQVRGDPWAVEGAQRGADRAGAVARRSAGGPCYAAPMKEGSRRRLTWLVLCCALTFAVIVLGGVVRLLRAGLSITEWNPVTGVVPPLGEVGWRDAFERYRATPEFAEYNSTIQLPEFREIYLLEYAHRLLARVTGLAVALPLAYGLARRQISQTDARPVLAVFVAGALQAGLGWLMVRSGLADVPHVSPYRLAAHLVVGTALFAALVWMIASERSRRGALAVTNAAVRRGAMTLAVALVTVTWGGLMAGTHAGHVFPSFPTMGGAWIPVDLASLPRTCATNPAAIHFVHRLVALVMTVACIAFAWSARTVSAHARLLAGLTLAALALQITLGAFVVLLHVPVALASLHQANAVVLVGLLTAMVHESSRPGVGQGAPSAMPSSTI